MNLLFKDSSHKGHTELVLEQNFALYTGKGHHKETLNVKEAQNYIIKLFLTFGFWFALFVLILTLLKSSIKMQKVGLEGMRKGH